jgi:predicted aspartyl protease
MSKRNGAAALFAALACAAAQLPAAAAEEHCRLRRVGTIPISWQGLKPQIEGSINGTPVPMLVDTGAYDVLVGGRLAERLKLSLAHTHFGTIGAEGHERSYTAHVAEITFGPVRWKGADLPSTAESGDQVLVGATFLFKRDLEWTGKELVFYDPEHCAQDDWLGHWDGDIAAVTLGSVASNDLRPVVTVQVDGHPLRALVDSGSAQTIIDLAAARGLGFDPGTRAPDGKSGADGAPAWDARFDTFELGGEVIRHPHIVVQDMWANARRDFNTAADERKLAREPQMVLGADFMKAHRILFAFSQRRMYFSYQGGEVFNAPTASDAPAAAPSAPEPGKTAAR